MNISAPEAGEVGATAVCSIFLGWSCALTSAVATKSAMKQRESRTCTLSSRYDGRFSGASPRALLERKLRRKLKLPRVKHRPRRTKERIWEWRSAVICRARDLDALNRERSSILVVLWRGATKVDGSATIDRSHFVHVWPVENVECVHRHLQLPGFCEAELIRETDVV